MPERKYHLFAGYDCYQPPFGLRGYVGMFGSPQEAAARWDRGEPGHGGYCDGEIVVAGEGGKLTVLFWRDGTGFTGKHRVPWGGFDAWVSSKSEVAEFVAEVRDVYRDNKAEVSREAAERAGVDLAKVRDRHKPEVPGRQLNDSAVAYLAAIRDVLMERVGWVPLAERDLGREFSRWAGTEIVPNESDGIS